MLLGLGLVKRAGPVRRGSPAASSKPSFMSGVCAIIKAFPNGPQSYTDALSFQGQLFSYLKNNAPRKKGGDSSGPIVGNTSKHMVTLLIESNRGGEFEADDQTEILEDQQQLWQYFKTRCDGIDQVYSYIGGKAIGSAITDKVVQSLDDYSKVQSAVLNQLKTVVEQSLPASTPAKTVQDEVNDVITHAQQAAQLLRDAEDAADSVKNYVQTTAKPTHAPARPRPTHPSPNVPVTQGPPAVPTKPAKKPKPADTYTCADGRVIPASSLFVGGVFADPCNMISGNTPLPPPATPHCYAGDGSEIPCSQQQATAYPTSVGPAVTINTGSGRPASNPQPTDAPYNPPGTQISRPASQPANTPPPNSINPYCNGVLLVPEIGRPAVCRWQRNGSGKVQYQLIGPYGPDTGYCQGTVNCWYTSNMPVPQSCSEGVISNIVQSQGSDGTTTWDTTTTPAGGDWSQDMQAPVDLTAPAAGVNGLGEIQKSDINWAAYILAGGFLYLLLKKGKW